MMETIVYMLISEGCYCEKVKDFSNAIRFYESSLPYNTTVTRYKYFRLNNLAFCLNYMRKFKESEPHLRNAIDICPTQHNAWKNLGVCLEHQDRNEDAARSFMNAIILRPSDKRAARHFMRLMARHPDLQEKPEFAEVCRSLADSPLISVEGYDGGEKN